MKQSSVVKEIRNRILIGELPHGGRLPSERALAEEFGASRTAVQAALKELESIGIVSRQANCRPVVVAQPHRQIVDRRSAADQIAIWMLPETQDLGGAMMLSGMRSAFSQENYSLLISSPSAYDTNSMRRGESQFFSAVKENPRVAGVITWDTGNPECRALYEELEKLEMPLVFVDRMPDFPIRADLVAANNRKASRHAIRYLIDLGHRSIAMVVGNDRASSVADRIDGYRLALRDHDIDLPFQSPIHLNTHDKEVEASADKVVEQLVSGSQPATAVFAVNDRVAFYLMEAAKRKGISIPGQFSLIGFDWLARWIPSGGDLTTLAQPFEEIGRAAAQRVLDRILQPKATPRDILFDAELVVKNSTARLPL